MTLTGTPSTGTEGWETFRRRVDDVVGHHPVVVDNRYTRWFATGADFILTFRARAKRFWAVARP